MAVAIRLRREGNRNNPYFRIVVADQRMPRDGRFIEIIGTYNPLKENEFSVDLDRADYWLGVGARPSETVNSLIKRARKGNAPPRARKTKTEAPEPVATPTPAPATGEPAPTDTTPATPDAAAPAPDSAEPVANQPEAQPGTETARAPETTEPAPEPEAEAVPAPEAGGEPSGEKPPQSAG